ncbi:MAG TPA: tRNA (adenosine(37)-N6)-dimethylallyltransferase MiaA [Nitrospirota bacterium]|nr:tRNA (adenosine(37)-N6)-dimethylallyltransferase MiaA [Nitrospirota bacterium]
MTDPLNKPILILAGPTAVGKTDVSLLLGRKLCAEIVSADSMQIYRGMDIGTAKPTPEERRLVYHHMIDIVEPNQPYSVGDYLRDARTAIGGIIATGGMPLVVGGTGLYIRALMRGLFHGPSADIELRERLLQREAETEPGVLYADLVKVDPEAAIKIHPNDLRRTIRALEVYYLRDRKLSAFQRDHAFQDKQYRFRLLFLVRSRGELYPRIEKRVDRMLDQGLEAEVKTLFDRGYGPELISMQGLGYKHFLAHFLGRTSREEAVALLKRDTKRYAKRQFTWFRREPDATWVDITGLERTEDILERIKKYVEISKKLV